MKKEKKGVTQAFYLPPYQVTWLEEMAEINARSKSYLVKMAIDKLIDMTGGL